DALRAAVGSAVWVQKCWDVNRAEGGPIRTDRMWFYGSFRYWGTNSVLPGSFYAVDRLAFTYTPDKSRPGVDDRPNKAENLRVTWQASHRNKVTLYGPLDQRCVCHIHLGSTITPEASQVWHARQTALCTG